MYPHSLKTATGMAVQNSGGRIQAHSDAHLPASLGWHLSIPYCVLPGALLCVSVHMEDRCKILQDCLGKTCNLVNHCVVACVVVLHLCP